MIESFIQSLQLFLEAHPVIAPIVFMLIRIVPVIFPPIPGIIFDLIAIAVFGWFWGFIYTIIALMTGLMIAFYLGRIFREPLVGRFVTMQKMHEWEEKFSENQKFWGLLVIRIMTSAFFDTASYVIGLTKVSVWKYFLATLIVAVPSVLTIYYFGELIISYTWVTAGLSAVSGIFMIFVVRFLIKQRKLKLEEEIE